MTTITLDSRTRPGTRYDVALFDDGTTACTCPAAMHGRHCWHVKAAREMAPPAYRLASMRTGKTLSTHATLADAIAAQHADHKAGGMALVDRM